MKEYAKRRGFTLVELLIVIIVIGILSAMMLLSSTEAVSSARAADIVSDLRNMKTAALEWYAENIPYVQGKAKDSDGKKFSEVKLSGVKDKIKKYLGNDEIKSGYSFGDGVDDGTWYAWYEINDARVREKLLNRKDTVGLVGASSGTATSGGNFVKSSKYVGLFIR
ncbi:MAG: prepilin-type N-terminal cleavage/methylation domain-containing protein [Synergistaceae bacterium]|nr:prepilin-type N-terminal cleavage/methylation domain-containing protein [Synergistaceae bacterium]